MLQTLDHLWREHLVNLDHLRSVIGFRGYAQRDPLNEYKSEAFELFQAMLGNLRQAVTAQLMRVEIVREAAEAARAGAAADGHAPRGRRARGWTSSPPARCWRMAQLGGNAGPRHRRARSERPAHLGQGRTQRGLPLRVGQEIQALPRRLRLTASRRNVCERRLPGRLFRFGPCAGTSPAPSEPFLKVFRLRSLRKRTVNRASKRGVLCVFRRQQWLTGFYRTAFRSVCSRCLRTSTVS